MTAGETDPPGK